MCSYPGDFGQGYAKKMQNGWIGKQGESYSDFVLNAATNEKTFAAFRRQPIYRSIVETLSAEEGAAYLSMIDDPSVRALCLASAPADRVGDPQTHPYDGVLLSPTTLRYGKVLCDLRNFFPQFHRMTDIVEIGVGYGGLARLVSEYRNQSRAALNRYIGVDLRPVALLARRYLETCGSGANVTFVASEDLPATKCDLVISNYAFSELGKAVQEDYLARVVGLASSGYLTMNSGLWGAEAFGHDCFTVEELLQRLPNAVLAYDRPDIATANYIIVFGEHELGEGVPLADIRLHSRELIAEREARRAPPFAARHSRAHFSRQRRALIPPAETVIPLRPSRAPQWLLSEQRGRPQKEAVHSKHAPPSSVPPYQGSWTSFFHASRANIPAAKSKMKVMATCEI